MITPRFDRGGNTRGGGVTVQPIALACAVTLELFRTDAANAKTRQYDIFKAPNNNYP